MKINLPEETIYCFFRLGLVTGLINRQMVIAWADRQILENPDPSENILDLSLACRQTYSQLIWMLNRMQGAPDYDLSLKMVFTWAGELLEQNPEQAGQIAQGLSLLLAEEYLPKDIRNQLFSVAENSETFQPGLIELDQLRALLRKHNGFRYLLSGITNIA